MHELAAILHFSAFSNGFQLEQPSAVITSLRRRRKQTPKTRLALGPFRSQDPLRIASRSPRKADPAFFLETGNHGVKAHFQLATNTKRAATRRHAIRLILSPPADGLCPRLTAPRIVILENCLQLRMWGCCDAMIIDATFERCHIVPLSGISAKAVVPSAKPEGRSTNTGSAAKCPVAVPSRFRPGFPTVYRGLRGCLSAGVSQGRHCRMSVMP